MLEWDDISVGQFSLIRSAYNDPDMTEEDRCIGLISFIYNVNPLELEFSDFQRMVRELEFMNTDVVPSEVKKEYILNGRKYTLQKAINHVSTAQYMDFHNYLKDGEADEKYADFISVFLIPEGMKYNDGYDIEDVKDDINRYMSITDALGIFSYFFHYFVRFVQIFRRFTGRRIERMKSLTMEEKQKMKDIINQMGQIGDSLESSSPFAKRRLHLLKRCIDSR